MTGKSAFTAQEWRIVGGAPFYAAAFVVASGPHHSLNTIRNMLTGANALAAGPATTNTLIADARADSTGPNGDPGATKATPENVARLRGLLEQAGTLIRAKGGADAAGYIAEVHRVATAAAAGSRDGILGTTGDDINPAEAAALDELASLLATEQK